VSVVLAASAVDAGVFAVCAVIVLAGALGVVFARNPVHSALMLVMTLFGIAVLFVEQHANFLAAVQVIVYAGAIVVLFLFVIMLLNLRVEAHAMAGAPLVGSAVAGGAALVVLLVGTLRHASAPAASGVPAGFGETVTLARQLFTAYLLPFELTSVLLLVAIVGAVALAKKPT